MTLQSSTTKWDRSSTGKLEFLSYQQKNIVRQTPVLTGVLDRYLVTKITSTLL